MRSAPEFQAIPPKQNGPRVTTLARDGPGIFENNSLLMWRNYLSMYTVQLSSYFMELHGVCSDFLLMHMIAYWICFHLGLSSNPQETRRRACTTPTRRQLVSAEDSLFFLISGVVQALAVFPTAIPEHMGQNL